MAGHYQELVAKHGNVTEAARAIGLPRTTFYDRYRREVEGEAQPLPTEGNKKASRQQQTHHVPTISEKELLATYDPYERARASMATIPGLIQPGEFVKDFEMRKAVGLTSDPRLFRELAEDPVMGLLPYQFLIGRGTKELLCWTDPDTKRRILDDYPLTTRDIAVQEE